MQQKEIKIPLKRGLVSTLGRKTVDVMISLDYEFRGIEYNREKKVNEYLFKQKLSNNEER